MSEQEKLEQVIKYLHEYYGITISWDIDGNMLIAQANLTIMVSADDPDNPLVYTVGGHDQL